MKTKTKTSKRIFSLFLAVFCTLGVFFVSYINVSASSFTINVDTSLLPSSGYASRSSYRLNTGATGTDIQLSDGLIPSSFSISFEGDSVIVGVACAWQVYSASAWRIYYLVFKYNGVNLSTSFSNPTVIDASGITSITISTSGGYGNTAHFYFKLVNISPPTPVPTPIPTPDPGGTIPTPSGDYGSFFQRMAQDSQSAFNALYLSWTNANNRFYSSIFFIGLPLLITVFGIVAGIILGDDD